MDPRLASVLELQLASWRAARDRGAERVGWKLGMGDRERIGPGPVIGHLTSESLLPPGGVYRGPPGDLAADAEVAVLVGAGGAIAGCAAALEICDLAGDDPPEAIVAANVFHRAVAILGARPTRHGGVAERLSEGGGHPADRLCDRGDREVDRLCDRGDREVDRLCDRGDREVDRLSDRGDRAANPDAGDGLVERLPEGGVEATLTVNGEHAAGARSASDFSDRVGAVAALLREMGEELRAGDWIITGSVLQVPIKPGDEVVADLGPLGRVGLTIEPR